MSTDERFDESITGWLEQTAPARLPDRVLEATFERTRTSRQQIGWRSILGRPGVTRSVVALGGAAAVVAIAAVVALDLYDDRPAVGGPSPSSEARSVFAGTWYSISDADGGTQTMTVQVLAADVVEVVVTDDIASVCSRTPSTMTGTGRLEGTTRLVIPAPVYTCDDGSEARTFSGPPLQQVLRNLTYIYSARTDVLTVGTGSVWTRVREPVPSLGPTVSGSAWPQSSLEEVQAAQELADAGDPASTWQVDPRLLSDEWWGYLREPGAEIVERFIREELGWDQFLFNPYVGDDGDGAADGIIGGVTYLRCGPGDTNPLYPVAPDGHQEAPGAEACAPTMDELRYESVSLDLTQPGKEGPSGIWVVSGWRATAPFAQTDPSIGEAEATGRIEAFLRARIAGESAEEGVEVWGPDGREEVPLLYATTSGARYERYEIEPVSDPIWPYARMEFNVRLFADGGETVVEQPITWTGDALQHDASTTTENGQPITLSHTSPDGEVTVSAPSTWKAWLPGKVAHELVNDMSMGQLWRASAPYFEDSGEHIAFVDPVAYDAWCAANGGSPLLSGPADAATIAQELGADPDFEATAPVAARVGGIEAISMDVTLAPGGKACGIGMIEISRWIHSLGWEPGLRQRLYLVDLPEGMSIKTLAITVQAPEERFQEFIAETAPIVESFEFHPGGGTTSPSEAP